MQSAEGLVCTCKTRTDSVLQQQTLFDQQHVAWEGVLLENPCSPHINVWLYLSKQGACLSTHVARLASSRQVCPWGKQLVAPLPWKKAKVEILTICSLLLHFAVDIRWVQVKATMLVEPSSLYANDFKIEWNFCPARYWQGKAIETPETSCYKGFPILLAKMLITQSSAACASLTIHLPHIYGLFKHAIACMAHCHQHDRLHWGWVNQQSSFYAKQWMCFTTVKRQAQKRMCHLKSRNLTSKAWCRTSFCCSGAANCFAYLCQMAHGINQSRRATVWDSCICLIVKRSKQNSSCTL